ncbi:MAG: SprT family zinc-dependent metalloprotease [Verrucomicrobiota bacterium]
MQLDFFLRSAQPQPRGSDVLLVDGREVVVHLFPNRQARRYILRISADGSVRVTVPRGGSRKAALDFARRHVTWIEQQLQKRQAQKNEVTGWRHGTEIFFRGQRAALAVRDGVVEFADQVVPLKETPDDLRPLIEQYLRDLARVELIPRTFELAGLHQLAVRRVTVRNQRSRWGSCSVRGTISLNWRLIQTPELVVDYIILHELMHLRELNHSPRYWQWVERVCPTYREAEAWLKQHGRILR